jgi:hypothetical protein
MTLPRLSLWSGLALLAVFTAALVPVWAADSVDITLAGKTLATLHDPGKFPALADRAAKVQAALTEVLSTQDTAHPVITVKMDHGIWVVLSGNVRVLSVLPKDTTGTIMNAKELAEAWGANLKRLLPLATSTGAGPAHPPAPTSAELRPATGASTSTPPAQASTVAPSSEVPAANVIAPPTTTIVPPPASAITLPPLTRTAATVLVLDALNSARNLPEDQYLSQRQKLADELLGKLSSFLTGQPLPAPAAVVTPLAPPPVAPATTTTLPPPATTVLPPAPPSALAVPADWGKLPIEQRLVKKFALAAPPYRALAATDPDRYTQAGNLLSAARASKAAGKFEESEGYLDSALTLMGITVPPAAH